MFASTWNKQRKVYALTHPRVNSGHAPAPVWLTGLFCGLVVVCAVGNVAHARGSNEVERAPQVTAVDVQPALALGDFDVAALGYRALASARSGDSSSE